MTNLSPGQRKRLAEIEYYDLDVAEGYKNASDEVVSKICNGCGTAGWKGKLVPDTIWGLCITPACQPHDWDYSEGKTKKDKDKADKRFLMNMRKIVITKGGVLMYPRLVRAQGYYLAVKFRGSKAFWEGKVSNEGSADCVCAGSGRVQ